MQMGDKRPWTDFTHPCNQAYETVCQREQLNLNWIMIVIDKYYIQIVWNEWNENRKLNFYYACKIQEKHSLPPPYPAAKFMRLCNIENSSIGIELCL